MNAIQNNLLVKKVAIVTNNTNCERHVQYYSTLEKYFIANGWLVSDNFDVDLVVISGCGFHNMMLQKVKNLLDELKSIDFEKNVVLTGCIPTTHESEWKKDFKGHLVKLNFETALDEIISPKIPFKDMKLVNMMKPHKDTHVTEDDRIFHIKISNGCVRKCSYCVIVKAKGRIKSISVQELEEQFKKAITMGYKKVFLMGEDTFAYGVDTDTTIIHLLKRFLEIKPDMEFHFGNLDHRWLVEYIDDIIYFCKLGAIKILHIGMQHTNEELLIRMGRGGTTGKQTYEAISKLKQACPNVYLGVDIIIGFPGETEEMFNNLLDFFKEEKYIDNVQHNGYSDIEGAPSSNFEGKVPSETIALRWSRMTRILHDRTAFNRIDDTSNFDVTFKDTRDLDYSFVKGSFEDECTVA